MTSITLLSHRTLRQKPTQRRSVQQLSRIETLLHELDGTVRKLTPTTSSASKPRFIGQK